VKELLEPPLHTTNTFRTKVKAKRPSTTPILLDPTDAGPNTDECANNILIIRVY